MVRVFGRGLPGPRAGAGPVGPEDRDTVTGHGLSSGHGLLARTRARRRQSHARRPGGPAGKTVVHVLHNICAMLCNT